MYKRSSCVILSMLMFALLLTGCTSEASNIGQAKEKEYAVDTGFTVTGVGSYDSADTAVVVSVDESNKAVIFLNMSTGKQYTLYYDGTTYIEDKHNGAMTISQIKPGDIVDVKFLKGKKQLASIQLSPEAWVYDNVSNYDLGGANKTASIGKTVYALPDEALILSEGKRVEVMDIVKQDVVTVSGINHDIYSISVEKGHGYLRLNNDQMLIGGWIEVGNTVIREITEDMLLIVPEGNYQVLLENKNVRCTKDIVIERNKELVLDVSDVEIAEEKTGRIIFDVEPKQARVYVDGDLVDIIEPVELVYGIHKVEIDADGYYSLAKYIQVGSEYASISFTLDEIPEEAEDLENSSEYSISDIFDYGSEESTYVPETVISNTSQKDNANLTTQNKVYIDAPRDVEVYLDGNYVGIAPVKFKKRTGSHTITLRKEGYYSRSYTIYLYNDGEDITYSFSELEKQEEEVDSDKEITSDKSTSITSSENGTSEDSTSMDSTSIDSTSQDSSSTDSTSMNSTSTDSTSQDSTSTDSTSTDSTSTDSTSTDSTSQDSSSTGSTSTDSTPSGNTSTDSTSQGGSSTGEPSTGNKPTDNTSRSSTADENSQSGGTTGGGIEGDTSQGNTGGSE